MKEILFIPTMVFIVFLSFAIGSQIISTGNDVLGNIIIGLGILIATILIIRKVLKNKK